MSKRFLLVLAACVAIFAGLLFINKKDAGAPTAKGGVTNHTYGEGQSGVTIVEYGDFQCPACYQYFPIFAQLKEKYKDQVTFQFRHFPIISAHPNAMAAHRAAEAASRQGKFWEMHDLLYSRQKSWESSNNASKVFEDYATELGLNLEQFRQDAASETAAANIQADFKAGEAGGVQGTPTFFINGKKIDSPAGLEAFDQLIQDAIKEKATS
jgi:protein-disulfide isomerase